MERVIDWAREMGADLVKVDQHDRLEMVTNRPGTYPATARLQWD